MLISHYSKIFEFWIWSIEDEHSIFLSWECCSVMSAWDLFCLWVLDLDIVLIMKVNYSLEYLV